MVFVFLALPCPFQEENIFEELRNHGYQIALSGYKIVY
jgi:hypothetical protein